MLSWVFFDVRFLFYGMVTVFCNIPVKFLGALIFEYLASF